MEKRSIDLGRCLVRDGKADCHRCEEICPQRAIASPALDHEACDGCARFTAVWPAAAIEAPEDYAEALKKTMALTPQVLMCGKASPGGVHCLGFLDRRLLWSLATKRPLSLDIARWESCRPAGVGGLQQDGAGEKAAEGRTAQLFPSSVPLDGRGVAGNSRSADRAKLPLRCFGLAAGAAGRSMRAGLWAGAARRLHGLWPLHRRLPDRGSRAGARRACGPALCGGILHRVQSLCTALPAGRAGTRAALCRAARFSAGPLT